MEAIGYVWWELILRNNFPNALKKIEDFKAEIDYHYIKDITNDYSQLISRQELARTQEII